MTRARGRAPWSRPAWWAAPICAAAALSAGCGVTPRALADDHTIPRLRTASEFDALSRAAFGTATAKFIITSYGAAAERDVRFFDSAFYRLHDEWYWFRLLNGASVPGDPVDPVEGQSFNTVAEIYAWAAGRGDLPLDLRFIEERLYSPRFYEVSFGPSRRYGLGSLVRVPPRNGAPERWAFELEYTDVVTHPQLVVFFEALAARVPPEVARGLHFLVRSADQEALAQQMERDRLPYWDRVLRYRDIVVPGAREVYSDGVAAGRLRVVRGGRVPDNTTADDLLVFDGTPDLLPPCSGVLTAIPQTPLAHVNLLARNRGIPNAYVAGLLDDPTIGQLERGYAPVVLFAEAPSRVVIAPITEAQFQRYGLLLSRPARAVQTPPAASLPYALDLAGRRPEEAPSLTPAIGGKCAGMISLLASPGLDAPERPQAITVRAYAEHVAPLRPRIEAAITHPAFERDARVRLLALQGEAAFRARHTEPADAAFLAGFYREHGPTSPLGSLARATGIRGLVESTRMAPATLAAIEASLRSAYGSLAATQGTRFRSSSNAEDIEGFNGAGLYESFTGFLDVAARPASDRNKTVERAVLRVWGSFWSFEAFEERRNERIDHLSAAMAVLAHPRFDDELERSTGVCTFTVLPPGGPDVERLEVNVQAGAESVANPNPQVLPEVARVLRSADGTIRVERARRSSLAADRDLLDDAALRALFEDTAAVTRAWLTRENTPRPAAQRARTLTLDFEFHDMAEGWPAVREGSRRPARLVLKQVRTLEPGARARTPEAAAWPMPRDVFVRVRRVTTETCRATVEGGSLELTTLRALTDASLPPDVGFATTPFDASITLSLRGASLPAWPDGTTRAADHTGYTVATTAAGRTFRFDAATAARMGAEAVTVEPSRVVLQRPSGAVTLPATCAEETVFATPRDYLLGLLPAR